MAASLPSPSIVGIVSSWSTQILIGDLVSGAKVSVFARDVSGTTSQIGASQAPGGGEHLIKIDHPAPGAVLWAVQEAGGAQGEGDAVSGPVVIEYAAGAAAIPRLMSRLYEGSKALWIEGVFPGATVRVEQGGTVLAKGQAAPLAGIMNRPIGTRLHLGQQVSPGVPVAIVVAKPDGTEISRLTTTPRAPREDYEITAKTRQLPPVVIASPLFACSSGVPLSGVVDGAEVTLIVNGSERAKATFDRPALTFLLSDADAVKEGDTVEARQSMWSTAPSDLTQKEPVRPAPTPGQVGNGMICAGARMIILSNLDSEAVVHVRMEQASAGGPEIIEIPYPPAGPLDDNGTRLLTLPAPLVAGSTLAVWQSRCEKTGPTSEIPVNVKSADAPPAVLLPPLRGCDEYVYRDGGGLPMRVYSARLAAGSAAGWTGGAISGWTIGRRAGLIAPLTPGDKIRAMVLACDGVPVWSPEDQPWIVEPGPSPDEAQQIATGLIFSLSPDPNQIMPLVEGWKWPIYILKGPRAHFLTLTGTGSPQFLGTGVCDIDDITTIPLSRPLIANEELLLQWWQCDRQLITKGNPTSVVKKIEAPLAPRIETPADGQSNLALGIYPVRAVDPGALTNRRASDLHVTVRVGGQPAVFDKSVPTTSLDGSFTIALNAATYVITAQSSNAAGSSPVTTVKITSVAPPVQPPAKSVHGKIDLIPERSDVNVGVYSITVDGKGFPNAINGTLNAKFASLDTNWQRYNDSLKIADLHTDAQGKFTGHGEFQLVFRVADATRPGNVLVVNDGFTVNVNIDGKDYQHGVVNSYDGSLT